MSPLRIESLHTCGQQLWTKEVKPAEDIFISDGGSNTRPIIRVTCARNDSGSVIYGREDSSKTKILKVLKPGESVEFTTEINENSRDRLRFTHR